MKKGWTYRKLGDVCDIICGQDYKAVQDDKGPFPIYGTGGIMGYASQSRCPAYSVIIGRKGSINNPLFVEQPFWNVDTAFGVVPNQTQIQPKFFYYFCKEYDFTKHDVSVTIPSLRRTDLLKIQVPIPPLAEQERIVAELDLLQGIIDKQRAQLKELDTLAQSIFYDMFGDPVENEKGWTKKMVKEIAQVKIGPFGSLLHASDYITGGCPVINPIHMKDGKICPDTDFTVDSKKTEEMSSYTLKKDDIIFGRRGEIGRCALVSENDSGFICGTGSLFVRFTQPIVSRFAIEVFLSNEMRKLLVDQAKGATMLNINCGIVEGLSVIQPPLPLQQSFATKIEAIERQKASINASIAETQKLFDYTMDKYFG